MRDFSDTHVNLAVVGLGYVGLPLAVEFAQHFDVTGFDINEERVRTLKDGMDSTQEVEPDQLQKTSRLHYTTDEDQMRQCNVYIVTAPTPIDAYKNPDLGPLLSASASVGRTLSSGDVVIYESTVYPGATEERCVPVLEEMSGLIFNQDFFVGYSPERINPGDKEHRFATITKVTSGSTPDCARFVDDLYSSVVTAGTHLASSIRVAEAAKVIENTQRDVNIALVNELALLFTHLGIDTGAVLAAAGTKWNFLPFRPGLVGGHCIGVDPYYLTYKAQESGFHPEIILAGRRINDSMGREVATQVVKGLACRGVKLSGAKALILGLTFKENTPDLRNTRVIDIIAELQSYGMSVDVHDPWCDPTQAKHEYDLDLVAEPLTGRYSCVILAVAHRQFLEHGAGWVRGLAQPDGLVYDVKSVLGEHEADIRL